jgi:hypothetical protein
VSEPRADLELPPLPVPRTAPARGALQRWMYQGGTVDDASAPEHGHAWYRVLWLSGVDYFSTLGYQPGIALLAAGAVAPVATVFLVLLTLLGALPVYSQVARRSYAGQGSIALLENLLPGWAGKLLVLVLLGFAATDFVITMTLSAADAAQHAVENPYLEPWIGHAQLPVTLGLLAALAVVFLKGFREAIGFAAAIAVPYLVLNGIVIGRGLVEIAARPELLDGWKLDLGARGDPVALLVVGAIAFPKLALGLSGFETGVAVMPQVSAGPGFRPGAVPENRIRDTRKLLACAALLMSVYLLGSSFVTTLLVSSEEASKGGPASGRALAFLAHRHLGPVFGTVYDASTLAILWFAGASAMAGMLNLVPRYLPRFGMAPRWVEFRRPLVLVLFAANVIVTLVFRADVEAQGGAYATGVLVLMLSAAVAVALALSAERRRPLALFYWLVAVVFGFTLVDNVVVRPDGIFVAAGFILATLALGAASRWARASELRVEGLSFADEESKRLWPELVGKRVNLVPVRNADPAARATKRAEILRHYRVQGPLAFVNVQLLDNRSEFLGSLRLRVRRSGDDYVLETSGAVAVANSIAYLSELMDPIAIFLGLTRQNPMAQSLRYVLFGEGEVGLLVYTTLLRYWRWTPEEDVRPALHLMSE